MHACCSVSFWKVEVKSSVCFSLLHSLKWRMCDFSGINGVQSHRCYSLVSKEGKFIVKSFHLLNIPILKMRAFSFGAMELCQVLPEIMTNRFQHLSSGKGSILVFLVLILFLKKLERWCLTVFFSPLFIPH